ncbi:MAG: SdpI family protein [Marivivens sp.]
MDIRHLNAFSLALIAGSFLFSAAVYLWLPDQIPSHWNLAGEVDSTMSKTWGAFTMPLIMLGLYGVFRVIPALSPKGYGIEVANSGFVGIRVAVFSLFALLNVLILLAALGVPIAMGSAVSMAVGGLLAVLGWFLDRLPRNFYVGIRTPWTIVDEDNWTRTHRLGKWLFMAAGFVMVVGGIMRANVFVIVAAALAAGLVPMVYSYLICRQGPGKA